MPSCEGTKVSIRAAQSSWPGTSTKFIPKLKELPGFSGYYLIEAGSGVMTSVSLFETAEQADKSSRIASSWVRDEKFEKVLPNPPKITFGEVVAREVVGQMHGLVTA
jgi:hypothetical protein